MGICFWRQQFHVFVFFVNGRMKVVHGSIMCGGYATCYLVWGNVHYVYVGDAHDFVFVYSLIC